MVSEVEEIVSSQDGVYTRDLCTTDTSVQLALPPKLPCTDSQHPSSSRGEEGAGCRGSGKMGRVGYNGQGDRVIYHLDWSTDSEVVTMGINWDFPSQPGSVGSLTVTCCRPCSTSLCDPG